MNYTSKRSGSSLLRAALDPSRQYPLPIQTGPRSWKPLTMLQGKALTDEMYVTTHEMWTAFVLDPQLLARAKEKVREKTS